jgi:hypothetical protein
MESVVDGTMTSANSSMRGGMIGFTPSLKIGVLTLHGHHETADCKPAKDQQNESDSAQLRHSQKHAE